MRANFNRWWLLPFGILAASALLALNIVVFQPSFVYRSFAMVIQQGSSGEPPLDCTGTAANDYACYKQRYQALVHGPGGVKAAFDDLKDQNDKNEFVKAQCHQLTHLVGRAAFDLYGDVPTSYDYGDTFCWSGYYHGVMEAVAAKIGPDKLQGEANSICAGLGDHQRYSFYHYNCVHGLGHGFMAVYDNELFKSLQTCDALTDDWERGSCYSGVFMENVVAQNNPEHPSKYLKADQPLYPCTDVENKYKSECYKMQTSYALQTQNYDFARVFELCGGVDGAYRPTCYQSLGRDASGQSDGVETARDNCMLGEDYEARSNCVVGAVKDFVSYYSDDKQAKELCGSFDDADLRDECLKEGEDYYKTTLQA